MKNLFDQEQWARRGENDARLAGVDARVVAAEAELALIDSGAWTGYTPTLTQSGAVTKTVTYAKYTRIGRTIIATVDLSATAAGSAGSNVLVGLPVAAATTGQTIGGGIIYDAPTTTIYTGEWWMTTTTTVAMQIDQASSNSWGAAPGVALASGDIIRCHVIYEAAT